MSRMDMRMDAADTLVAVSPTANPKHTPARSVRVADPLWDEAKQKAAERGETLTDVIVRALQRYVARK